MTAAERLAVEAAEVLPVAYVADLEPLGDLFPLVRTRSESPYVPLDYDREEGIS